MSVTATAAAKPKEKVVNAKKPTTKSHGVPYRKYMLEAIRELKERTGSSIPAISKYILTHHKEVQLVLLVVQLRLQLKRMVKEGLLKKAKASFLLTDKAKKGPKKAKKPKTKKAKKAKKPKAKKAKKPKKKTEKKDKKPKKKSDKPKKKAEKKVKKEKPKKVTKPKAAKKEKPKKVAAPKKAKK
jgi:outer membrane biosynthesis protein TonB